MRKIRKRENPKRSKNEKNPKTGKSENSKSAKSEKNPKMRKAEKIEKTEKAKKGPKAVRKPDNSIWGKIKGENGEKAETHSASIFCASAVFQCAGAYDARAQCPWIAKQQRWT